MTMLAIVAAVLVVAWAVLVVVAQLLNPDQSPLTMGMSGLARGRAPWVMKSVLLARGVSALVLVAALPAPAVAGLVVAGVALFWVWGVGSARWRSPTPTCPGEAPTRAGAAHALIAMVAYVAGAAGAIVLSLDHAAQRTVGVATWALPISIIAAVALVVQFVAFGAAAREARASTPAAAAAVPAAEPSRRPPSRARAAAPPAAGGVPPQLGADAGVRPPARSAAAARGRGPDGPPAAPARPRQLRRPLPARLRRAAHGLDAARRARPALVLAAARLFPAHSSAGVMFSA